MTARQRALWVKYRTTEEDYAAVLKFQGGVCAGCGESPRKTRLAVDHDHKTGRIRGLLCWLCNRAIGILRDNSDTATRLGKYLAAPTYPAALGKETYGLIGKAKHKKVMVYGPPVEVTIRKRKP